MLGEEYEGVDTATQSALKASEEALLKSQGTRLTVHENAGALRAAMAGALFADISNALAEKGHATLIVPVGPVGQYDLLAERCARDEFSLADVTFIIMDEYLRADNTWLGADDPLSFRGHMNRFLMQPLPETLRPRLVVPDPAALDEIPRIIDERGLDFCYAGVGITGHLAFNDPIANLTDAEWFARLPTRIVQLSPETRLINAVTAARGNVQRIPLMAVTVGMKEILAARTLRIWMNRHWQAAALRRMLLGPVTAAFPASLIQHHAKVTVDATREVLAQPDPGLM